MSFELLDADWHKAMQFVKDNTKKDGAEILNRAALHSVIGGKGVRGAMQRTPKGDKAKIKSTLERSVGGKGASEGVKIYRNQYGTFSRRSSRSKGAAGDSMLKYLALKKLRAKGIRNPSQDMIQKKMNSILRQRQSAVGYTANAGWSKSAKAFGGTGARSSRGVQSGFNRSRARFGYGEKATAGSLAAEIANTAPAAEKIGLVPLKDALNDVARDMVEHATKKLQQTFDKVNA